MKTYIVIFDYDTSTMHKVATVFNKTFSNIDELKAKIGRSKADIMQLSSFCQDVNSGNDVLSCSYIAPVFILN